jgi:hypothetical protein
MTNNPTGMKPKNIEKHGRSPGVVPRPIVTGLMAFFYRRRPVCNAGDPASPRKPYNAAQEARISPSTTVS